MARSKSNDLEPIDRHCAEQRVALIDEVQYRRNKKGGKKRAARNAVRERITIGEPLCHHLSPNLRAPNRPDDRLQFCRRFDFVVGFAR